MIIGISLPLYTFTNLVLNNYRQKSMYEEFKLLQEKMSEEEKTQLENSIKEYNNNVKSSSIVDPFSNEEYNTVYEFKKGDPDGIFAYIRIPTIDLYKPIRLDASYKHLDNGVAHIDGTALPTGGNGNRSVIAGHRGWYKDVMFLNISKLKKGDKVYIERAGKTLTYVVSNTEIIKPYEWEKLEPEKDIHIQGAHTLSECKKMLQIAKAGKLDGYLLEGMACPGGCVAGVGTIASVNRVKKQIEKFKKESTYPTPLENIHIEKERESI